MKTRKRPILTDTHTMETVYMSLYTLRDVLEDHGVLSDEVAEIFDTLIRSLRCDLEGITAQEAV